MIRVFKRKDTMTFCELCYKIYDTRYVGPEVHVWGTGVDVSEAQRPYTLGNRTLAFYPDDGEAKHKRV